MNKKSKLLLIILIFIVFLNVSFNMKAKDVAVYGVTKYEVGQFREQVLGQNKSMIVLFIKEKFIPHKKIPYIDKYEINLFFPNRVDIVVYENKPIGYIRYMNTYFYFDKEGYVIDATSESENNIPEFRGISFSKIVLNQKIAVNDDKIFSSILNISENILDSNLPIYLVNYNNLEDIRVFFASVEVKLGDNENMEYKFNTLKNMYDKIKSLKGILDISDAKENMIDEKYIFKTIP